MIKYGLGGLPLKKQEETETVLTNYGLIRRKKESHKDNIGVEFAERLASRNTKIDNKLLARCLGKSVEKVMTDEEKFFRKIAEDGGMKKL